MAKVKVTYKAEVYNEVIIEAENEDDALEKVTEHEEARIMESFHPQECIVFVETMNLYKGKKKPVY